MTFKQLLKKVTNCSETNIPEWEGSGFAFFERFCANIWWCVTYHFQSDYLFFVTKAVKKMSRREVIFGKIGLTSMYIAFQIVLPGVLIALLRVLPPMFEPVLQQIRLRGFFFRDW